MQETLTQCPICQQSKFDSYLTCQDFTVSKELFRLVRCQSCKFVFTNPRPDEKNIGKYYQSEEYISHQNKANSLTNILYKIVRNYTLRKKVQMINSISSKGDILDFGCGTGYFLDACKKDKWNVTGVEPDSTARAIAKEKLNDNVHQSLDMIKKNKFKVITLWHVLEHIHQLNQSLEKFHQLLDVDGKLVLALPNLNSFDAKKYGAYWAGYDVPRHLYHFDQKSVSLLANKHGYVIQKIHPMIFDSFYVSMLSEKYKGNTINLLKPLVNGCKSNIYAKKDQNYSSLIYILSK